jgi:hypothetical protein
MEGERVALFIRAISDIRGSLRPGTWKSIDEAIGELLMLQGALRGWRWNRV